jgi:hypothetical protein
VKLFDVAGQAPADGVEFVVEPPPVVVPAPMTPKTAAAIAATRTPIARERFMMPTPQLLGSYKSVTRRPQAMRICTIDGKKVACVQQYRDVCRNSLPVVDYRSATGSLLLDTSRPARAMRQG